MLNKGHGTKRKTVSELIDDAINEALGWKLAGSDVGSTTKTYPEVTYPNTANEILCVCSYASRISVLQVPASLENGDYYGTAGYATVDNRNCLFAKIGNKIQVVLAFQEGTSYFNNASCVLTVYYR